MDFNYMMASYNPTGRKDVQQALEQAVWTAFGYFMARSDRFSVYYHPEDPAVAPLLALGFAPRKPEIGHTRLELTGALDDGLRRLLWGEGAGKFPWYAVTLYRGEEQLYNIVEHEQMGMMAAEPDDLAALTAAGVNPRFIRTWRRSDYLPSKRHDPVRLLAGALAGAAGVSEYTIRPCRPPAEDWGACWVLWGRHGEAGVRLEYAESALAAVHSAEAAAAVIATQLPAPQPGDSLRLDATGAVTRLPPRPVLRAYRFTHSCLGPTRAEWLKAVRMVGARADRFAVSWRDEPPAANGWHSGYGLEQLRPYFDREGSSDLLALACEGEGDLTPAVLALLLDEPPSGIPDLEHVTMWQAGNMPPAPWWWLVLLRGSQVLLESSENGVRLRLDLTDEEAALLDVPPGRLYDHAGVSQQTRAMVRLKGGMHRRLDLPGGNPDLEQINTTHPAGHQWQLRHKDGTVLASLTVTAGALRPLALMREPQEVVLAAPAGQHLLVEWDGRSVRCRVLPKPPAFP